MVNARVLSPKRRNAVKCRNRTKAAKAIGPPKSEDAAMTVCWLNPPKAIPVLVSYAKTPKSDRTPPNCPWHRIIQRVSANALILFLTISCISPSTF